MDVEFVARSSLSSLQKTQDEICIVSPGNLADWTWTNLMKQFESKGLERLYLLYRRRLENGYLSLFVLLQLILGVVHCTVLVTTVPVETAIVDLITTGVVNALLFPIIALSFRAELAVKKSYLPIYLSCTIIALLVTGDLVVVIFYTLTNNNDTLFFRPTFTTHTLLVCYIFLPLSSNLQASILGATASFCYLAGLFLITYRNDPVRGVKITIDLVYYLCVNCIGLYFRFMNEVMIKRSFLDRRKCVETTLKLNYEKDQEEQLTRSILPPHFAAKIKEHFRDICKFIVTHKSPYLEKRSSSIPRDLYVEMHDNVSILYADVVNFSGLTVTLPVKKLVETLHDLFGSFDEASERHNVLRIKFLGDCYYCVSGVPIPNPQHAKSCVDLGLDMISIISDVRARVQKECGVDVNMRIGVHSGKIYSGILGINKWQYDIWSRDVIIANKMEQTGEAGKVHVTQQTLDLLDVRLYRCRPVTKLKDDTLRKYGIQKSYLVSPSMSYKAISRNNDARFVFVDKRSTSYLTGNKNFRVKWTQPDTHACSFRRTIHFMDSYYRDYHLMLKAADAEMEKAIEQMPLSKWQQWRNWDNINPLFLSFSQWSWEVPYLREPDPLFKFCVICASLILLLAGFNIVTPTIFYSSKSNCNLTSATSIIVYVLVLLFIISLVPTTWTQFLWDRWHELYDCDENSTQQQPRNKILNFFYRTSVEIFWNEIFRVILYCTIVVLVAFAVVFSILLDAHDSRTKREDNQTSSEIDEIIDTKCIYSSWQITTNCCLVVFTTFVFLRIHFLLKLCIGILIATFYAWNVSDNKSFIFLTYAETWNPYLDRRAPHILTIVYLIISLHLIDRQAEYLNRLDYQWKRQLIKEQDEAFHTRNANKLLLRNILPEHVAEYYLNIDRIEENSLYHEAHDNVAVMFATLTDLSIDESNILVDFNEIICQFDKLLFKPNYMSRVEKIKLAGTTYMAACGLETTKRGFSQNLDISDLEPKYSVVQIMVQFAAEMMGVLKNMETLLIKPYKLRIGISHGEVTAGVVGAQKPLYDIWGDAVNMASRMDTTGEPQKIQVTKETAAVLEEEGVKCDLRGETYVKPKGLVITYFVSLDEKMELGRIELPEETSL